MQRDELVAYLDTYLQLKEIEDASNNGLQVEGADNVSRLAFAVDAGLAVFEEAQVAGAQMLIVHHGLYWSKPVLLTGIHRRRMQVLFDAGLSLYAAHLPLDFHEEVGNNATLARWLHLQEVAPVGNYKGHPAGFAGRLAKPCSLGQFVAQLERSVGEPVVKVWPFGAANVERVGIVSGAAASLLDQAAEAGVDVFLTGEVSHIFFHQAREVGLNIVYGGHYATETAGLKALAEHLSKQFGLETVFLDLPTEA
jgi:dinuclear metal center YbgI/SA1388 family protein